MGMVFNAGSAWSAYRSPLPPFTAQYYDAEPAGSAQTVTIKGYSDGGNGTRCPLKIVAQETDETTHLFGNDGSGQYGTMYIVGDRTEAGGRIFELSGLDRADVGDIRRFTIYAQFQTFGWSWAIATPQNTLSCDENGILNNDHAFASGGEVGITQDIEFVDWSNNYRTAHFVGGILVGID